MRTIGVITVARSDWGIYQPILRKIQGCSDLDLHLMVSGMHLSPEFGQTVKVIESEGFEIKERVEMLLSSDTPEGISKSMGLGTIGFAQAFARFQPDILLVLGDRFEMLTAVIAAMPFTIPVAHIHGGETTEGSIDEAIRHSITKMSHLHFVSTENYRRRVVQLGEEPWRVTISGAPSLDNIGTIDLLSLSQLRQKIKIPFKEPPLLATFHPVTLEYGDTNTQVTELLAALKNFDLPIVFTYPNADTHGRLIINAINQFIETHPQAWAVANLGTQAYFSLLKTAVAMVGNSSSGIIEAASFELPVVNIGNRQHGRIHSDNVINVGNQRNLILKGIKNAISPEFRARLSGMVNPYGRGNAASTITHIIQNISLDQRLIQKKFYDIPSKEAG